MIFEWDENKKNDRIKIISARAATKSERKIYEQGI